MLDPDAPPQPLDPVSGSFGHDQRGVENQPQAGRDRRPSMAFRRRSPMSSRIRRRKAAALAGEPGPLPGSGDRVRREEVIPKRNSTSTILRSPRRTRRCSGRCRPALARRSRRATGRSLPGQGGAPQQRPASAATAIGVGSASASPARRALEAFISGDAPRLPGGAAAAPAEADFFGEDRALLRVSCGLSTIG